MIDCDIISEAVKISTAIRGNLILLVRKMNSLIGLLIIVFVSWPSGDISKELKERLLLANESEEIWEFVTTSILNSTFIHPHQILEVTIVHTEDIDNLFIGVCICDPKFLINQNRSLTSTFLKRYLN